jgi:hypothetical protein
MTFTEDKITILETKLLLLGVSLYSKSCTDCTYYFRNSAQKCFDVHINGYSINHYCLDNWSRIMSTLKLEVY